MIVIPTGITSSAIRLKTCAITPGIKKYKSMINKKKKKHDKIVLLAKSKLYRIEFLTPRALIDSNISYDEFLLINNVLNDEDKKMMKWKKKSKIEILKQFIEYFSLFIKQCYHIVRSVEKI